MTEQEFLQSFIDFNVTIYNFVYFNVGKNKEVAEDVTQETFLRAWKYRESFNPDKAQLKTWYFQIARNLTIDSYKKKENLNTSISELESGEDDSFSDIEYSIDATNALTLLNEEERSILILRYIDELELNEIAEIIDKSYDATKVYIHRIIQKLKILIQNG